MNPLLAGLIALTTLTWGWNAQTAAALAGGNPWLWRQEALNLTGLLAIALMSLAMFLATRPVWLESPLGGLDRMYRAHKWAGILGGLFAALHWLVELSDDLIKAWVGRTGRPPRAELDGMLESLRHLAKDMGEWGIYVLLALLALALWKRFPYRPWRFLHQAMPALYLILAFHAALLAPPDYWRQPVGMLLAGLLALGAWGSLVSLLGRIGRRRQVGGEIIAVDTTLPDVTGVSCRLDAGWPGHRPGQFAFVRFADGEPPHPFTLAGADRGNREIHFQIKALGDYTGGLGKRLAAGQPVTVEGPYGRFDLARRNPAARQIWVAGGIGVTPFLAWLEALQDQPEQAPAAELHYCTRDRLADPFVARLQVLCAGLPGLRLRLHGSRQGERLDAATLLAGGDGKAAAEVWYCGPRGLADSLKAGLGRSPSAGLRFHQEAFELR